MRSVPVALGMGLLVASLWMVNLFSGQAATPKAPPPPPRAQATAKLQPATSRPARAPTRPVARKAKASQKDDQDCDSGCAASKKPKKPALSPAKFSALLKKFAKEPLKAGSKALETLLFYGKYAAPMLKPNAPLPPKHYQFLKRELSRTHFMLSFRIINKKGVVRLGFKKRIKIGGHFDVKAQKYIGIQQPNFGGKSKRVGLHHIWVRI